MSFSHSENTTSKASLGITPYDATLDSFEPYLKLPTGVCEALQQLLGIETLTTTGMMLLDNSIYDRLSFRNISINFTVGWPREVPTPSETTDRLPPRYKRTTEITVPFKALVQPAHFASAPEFTYYIPVQCSKDPPFSLGRTFLQRPYITADFKGNTFNLSSANVSSEQPSNILIIPDHKSYERPPEKKHLRLAPASIIGIIIPAVIVPIALWYIVAWRMKTFPFRKNDPAKEVSMQRLD
jgi:hypothetical protein